MCRLSHRWIFAAILAAPLLAGPARGGEAPPDGQILRRAIDDYAQGNLESAWFGFWTLASAGDPAAQFNLGQLYRLGQGIPPDSELARRWYAAAAAQGYKYAQYNLAVMYELGNGTAPDLGAARRWYRHAAEQNVQGAAAALKRVEERLAELAAAPDPPRR